MKQFAMIIAVLCTFLSYGQSDKVDTYLMKKYSEKELINLKKDNAELYNFYLKSFEKGIVIIDHYQETLKNKLTTIVPTPLTVQLKEGEIFNYLDHSIDLKEQKQYFSINNNSTLVIIFGKSDLLD